MKLKPVFPICLLFTVLFQFTLVSAQLKVKPSGIILGASTYWGGKSNDIVYGMCTDEQGYIYLTGSTASGNFPVLNAIQPVRGGGICDAFITKLKPGGTDIVFSTYFGGSEGDSGYDIAVDKDGNISVTGSTNSTDLPLKAPLMQQFGGGVIGDAFILKLDPTGSKLLFSTYWGGSDSEIGEAIAFDADGNILVSGGTFSKDFPVKNAFQDKSSGGWYPHDAFVAKISRNNQLLFSTYLGGICTLGNHATDIASDIYNNIYVSGYTSSTAFPVINPLQRYFAGTADGFITKFSPTGIPVYSTFLGGSQDDKVLGVCVDALSNIYLTGITSSADFPTKNPLLSKSGVFDFDIFIAKISPAGNSLIFSTYFGSSSEDAGNSICLDKQHNIYVAGYTTSPNFYTVDKMQPYNMNSYPPYKSDAVIIKLNASADKVLYASFLGGSENDEAHAVAADAQGNVFVAGMTCSSSDFPVFNPLEQKFGGGDYDGFISKLIEGSLPAPGNLRSSVNGNMIYLNWDSPASSSVLEYNIYRSNQSPVKATSANLITSCQTTFFTDQIIMTGSRYYYVVTAMYAEGESMPSNEIEVNLTAVKRINEAVPEETGLFCNYPNPFNNSTVIEFTLKDGSFVGLAVFDQLGKLVETLVCGELQPGKYQASFYPKNNSSGIYYFRLTAGSYTKTRKMMVVK